MKTVSFSIPQLLKQLKNDLWCKEVVTGYTTSYTWEANQLGHFAIGFAPTILLGSLLAIFFPNSAWPALAALLPVTFMVYKELGDVSTQKLMYAKSPGVVYLNTKDVWLDAGTAVFFSTVGAWVAASVYLANLLPPKMAVGYPLITFACLLPACAFVMKYWISKKICFQNATLPYTMRLSNIPFTSLTIENIGHIQRFMSGGVNVLTLSGADIASELAVALGTELSFQQYKVRYGTLDHFLGSYNKPSETVNVAYTPWAWSEVDFIILDEVESGQLMKLSVEAEVLLKQKNVIFVTDPANRAAVVSFLKDFWTAPEPTTVDTK